MGGKLFHFYLNVGPTPDVVRDRYRSFVSRGGTDNRETSSPHSSKTAIIYDNPVEVSLLVRWDYGLVWF